MNILRISKPVKKLLTDANLAVASLTLLCFNISKEEIRLASVTLLSDSKLFSSSSMRPMDQFSHKMSVTVYLKI